MPGAYDHHYHSQKAGFITADFPRCLSSNFNLNCSNELYSPKSRDSATTWILNEGNWRLHGHGFILKNESLISKLLIDMADKQYDEKIAGISLFPVSNVMKTISNFMVKPEE
jgi:hypothetical protein